MVPEPNRTTAPLVLTVLGSVGSVVSTALLLEVAGSAALTAVGRFIQDLLVPPERRDPLPYPDFPVWLILLLLVSLLLLSIGLAWLIARGIRQRQQRKQLEYANDNW